MKHSITLVLVLICAVFLPLSAQNNPYAIDDECHKWFMQAELSVNDLDDDSFETANDRLLQTAIAKGDEKARTLYYVERLKRISQRGQKAPAVERQSWNDAVNATREETCRVALETGYKQYYYYAYELCQNYYYNTRQTITALTLLNGLMEQARAEEDAYGQWLCLRYLSQLYLRQSDPINAKTYLLELVEIYENTDDPTIRRQGLTRQLLDLTEIYETGSDSARLFLSKAEKAALTHLDSLRVKYFASLQAAWDGDYASYHRLRDYCLNDRSFPFQVRTGENLFHCIDHIVALLPIATYQKDLDTLYYGHQRNYISKFAAKFGVWEACYRVDRRELLQVSSDLSRLNKNRLDEIAAQMGNNKLSADLAAQSQKLARNTIIIAILLTLILVGALVFTALHVRQLNISKRKDKEQIAHLQEANEKVRLANEAKTRFVQNMSHEVRTPLNAIVGFSQLLALPDGTFPPEEKEAFSGHIVNNTKMLTMLLDDILNASAMDSGNYRIMYEDGECHFMCQAAISSSEHRLQPGVRMYYAPESEEPFTFRTDPRRVQQILINLLTNACKHTPSGEIRLSSSTTERPGWVRFSVTDTGPGVPAEQAEVIFDRFTKLNEFVQGTGLGLSICRDIASRMGALVYLDTQWKGPGARFVFEVPVTPPEQA